MSTPRIIPADLLHVQIAASDPAVSAWVAANAGSGKTHVLAQRVIRLLLDGVDPAKILCITFTKAAAANMALRVFDELRRWTALDDEQLDAAIRAISNVRPEPRLRALARRLFALALETPGGLKVQTIHAFCTRLLHQFPFEADVPARFTVLDEAAEAQLLGRTSLDVLLEAARESQGALGRALATAIATVADQTFKAVVAEAIRKRDMVRDWVGHGGSIEGAVAQLCGALGISPAETVERVEQEITEGVLFPPARWRAAAAILAQGGRSEQQQAQRLRTALAASGAPRVDSYLGVFFTDSDTPRQRVASRATETEHPELVARLGEEQARLLALLERRKAVACRDRTAALLAIADAVIARYQAEKERRSLLDYDDLIDKTLVLLGEQRAAWVHYKLDRGIDHLLIDEAQDTSPKQWRIIRALTAEFFAGAGARSARRTIFAVGDEKQSIFSFQGAAPREFDAMRKAFETLSRGIERDLRQIRFRYSFRSGPNVLAGVDAVFARPHAFQGLSADAEQTLHEPLPDAAPGLIEIWPLVMPEEKREIEAWQAPFDALKETSPQVRLAEKIARNVKHWIARGTRAGDVLVLVRQRGPLFEAIIRALKEGGIAVAGADRLVLTEHIAAMDLMALADALLLADDDLALASVLKSPLFGLDEADLFELAWQRRGSLRQALRDKASTQARFAAAADKLERYGEWARREGPFAFYARVLGKEGGRRRFLARLSHEADDALQEFLNLALDYERRETPSLQGFLAWLRAAQTDVKRDMEIARNEVRVMTVHGAKGLEAPIVILADTTTPPPGPPQRQPRLLAFADEQAAPGTPARFVWAAAKVTDCGLIAAARARARAEAADEYRRLLYVAMTRAIDRLIVCGFEGERTRPEGCWYNLVFDALGPPVSCAEPADDGEGEVWRYCKMPSQGAGATAAAIAVPAASAVILPAWLARDAAIEQPAVELVSPSAAYDEVPTVRPGAASGDDRRKARKRGELMHRLLQSLPDIAGERRAEAARRLLARAQGEFSAEECENMAEQVRCVLDDRRFCALFAPGSRAEVPVVGRLARPGRPPLAVSGQLDRLAVTAGAVLIADYKTDQTPPRKLEEVPAAYLRQLALYRAVIGSLYPDKTVRAALLWTYTSDLMEIPATTLDREIAALTTPSGESHLKKSIAREGLEGFYRMAPIWTERRHAGLGRGFRGA